MSNIEVGDAVEAIGGPFDNYIGCLGKVSDMHHDGYFEVSFERHPLDDPMYILYKPSELSKVTGEEGDNVNSPSHYGQGKIEAIEYIEDFLSTEEYIGYLRGNIAKYLHRWRFKGKPVEDLKKANWYLDRLIEVVDSEQKEV